MPKVVFQSYYRKSRPKHASQNSNAASRSCLKAGPENCPKLLSKALIPKAAILQICSPKRLPKAILQSGSRKLRPKVVAESYTPKLLCFKPVPQSGSSKLLLLPKAAPQSCSTKLGPQSRSPKLLLKAAPNSCSPKLLKFSQSCFLKLLPKAVVLQRNCSSMLLQSRKIAPHNCFPKLLSKVATKSRVPKQRAQANEASTVCVAISQRCVLDRAQRQ